VRNINNIASLAERNRTASDQQVLEFGKASYSIERDLIVLKRAEVDEEDEDELDEEKEDANEVVFDKNCRRFEREADDDGLDEDEDDDEDEDAVEASKIVNLIRT